MQQVSIALAAAILFDPVNTDFSTSLSSIRDDQLWLCHAVTMQERRRFIRIGHENTAIFLFALSGPKNGHYSLHVII